MLSNHYNYQYSGFKGEESIQIIPKYLLGIRIFSIFFPFFFTRNGYLMVFLFDFWLLFCCFFWERYFTPFSDIISLIWRWSESWWEKAFLHLCRNWKHYLYLWVYVASSSCIPSFSNHIINMIRVWTHLFYRKFISQHIFHLNYDNY